MTSHRPAHPLSPLPLPESLRAIGFVFVWRITSPRTEENWPNGTMATVADVGGVGWVSYVRQPAIVESLATPLGMLVDGTLTGSDDVWSYRVEGGRVRRSCDLVNRSARRAGKAQQAAEHADPTWDALLPLAPELQQ